MSFAKDTLGLILLVFGVLLITAGLTSDNVGKFRGWFGAAIGSAAVMVAMWLGG